MNALGLPCNNSKNYYNTIMEVLSIKIDTFFFKTHLLLQKLVKAFVITLTAVH